ncbi:hypothetical protein BJY00DRAFT_276986 [Aspergillus carlsbadensis]|nr:hypothetical protein BJY00DRAFT_276986 [Aspergillus carlsbadensis]
MENNLDTAIPSAALSSAGEQPLSKVNFSKQRHIKSNYALRDREAWDGGRNSGTALDRVFSPTDLVLRTRSCASSSIDFRSNDGGGCREDERRGDEAPAWQPLTGTGTAVVLHY